MSFQITNKLTEVPYKKLKQLVYYEKNQQFLRKKLAEFECSDDFEKRLKAVEKVALSDNPAQTKAFLCWLSEIGFVMAPKSVAGHQRKNGTGLFVTNVTTHSRYVVPKVNYFFDGPIELYLIAVIWIMNQGVHLDRRLGRHCKGSRLHPLVGDDGDHSAHLFQKYHELYAQWRDGGIGKSRELLFNEKSSVCILALDLQEYYYRIQIDWDALEADATSNGRKSKATKTPSGDAYGPLTACIKAICESYKTSIADSLAVTHSELPSETTCLPIGLPCSPIIANWYLTEFDTAIIKEVLPAYYSRYVDDILIVLARELDPEGDPIDGLMQDVFEGAGVFKTEKESARYRVATTPGLYLQKSKCILQYFEAGHSFAGLEKFRKQLEQNASDFALLPVEGEDSPVEQVAYDLLYDGSVNKLRSVKEIAENRWELASISLSKPNCTS